MAMREFKFNPGKTYKTEENARNAANGAFSDPDMMFMVVEHKGRFAPVFIGERSIHAVHAGHTVVA